MGKCIIRIYPSDNESQSFFRGITTCRVEGHIDTYHLTWLYHSDTGFDGECADYQGVIGYLGDDGSSVTMRQKQVDVRGEK